MNPRISVVIAAFNAAATIAEAVRAVMSQPLPEDEWEFIVVDDGSSDVTAELAKAGGAHVLCLGKNQGVSSARNAGVAKARAPWVAFTDADCIPSRRWLPLLLAAAESADRSTLGFAGRTLGFNSQTPAARFMDLIGALDAEQYMRHEAFPWAPSCNLVYRRSDLLEVGGFDPALRHYETPDLHMRLTRRFGGSLKLVPGALVLHRHRASWGELWRQQRNYGVGYAYFLNRYADRWPWSFHSELKAWMKLMKLALAACAWQGERGLVRRGLLVKHLSQHLGFASTFYKLRKHQVSVKESFRA